MDVATVALAVAVAVAAYAVWFLRLARTTTGPRLWPIVGSLPGLARNRDRLHDWITDNLRACGGTYQTCTCAVPLLARRQALTTVTCDPRNLEHVLRSRFHNYPKGPRWQVAFHDLLGDGIFNSDGDRWLLQRKTAALEFTTRTLRAAMSRWVSGAVHRRLLPILDAARDAATPVDLQDLLLRLTFDNICGLTFGKDPETLSPRLPENAFAVAFDLATEATLHRFLLPQFLWKLKRILRVGTEASLSRSVAHVERYLAGVIKARKHELDGGGGHDDLLSRFMRKAAYPDSFLQQVALNFILAGRDTSSAALSWFFWLMTRHPAVEENVVAEICSVLAETRPEEEPSTWVSRELTFQEVDRLVYLKAALSETLRLYPSIPEDSKHAEKDDVLPDGTFVPAGSAVTYSIYAAGRMASAWGEDCMEYRPERWLEEAAAEKDSFRFVAFNAGPRVCLGKELAYLQMKAVAAAVLLRFRLEVAEGHRVEQKMSLTLFMKHGLRVVVRRRDLAGVIRRTCEAPPVDCEEETP